MKEFILQLAEEAGELAVEYLNNAKISSKGHKNIVTEADFAVENLIVGKIEDKFPEHNIVAEESPNKMEKSKYTWYIDPIDGTANYAHGDPNFCVSIALAVDDEVKYACINIPMLEEIYYAEKGKGTEVNGKKVSVSNISKLENAQVQTGISPLKNSIDASLKIHRHFMLHGGRAKDYGFCAGQLAYVASGKADALVKRSQHPWDVAAGILLVEEAGGKVTDEKGERVILDGEGRHHIIASNKVLHDEVMKNLKTIKIGKQDQEWFK